MQSSLSTFLVYSIVLKCCGCYWNAELAYWCVLSIDPSCIPSHDSAVSCYIEGFNVYARVAG